MAQKKKADVNLEDAMGLVAQREEFLETFFRKGAEFANDLLAEVQSLRERISNLNHENAALKLQLASDDAIRDLLVKIEHLEREKNNLASKVTDVKQENDNYFDKFSEVENELDAMANLYVASYQLHAAYKPQDVLSVLEQMLMQFVGTSSFAVYVRRDTADGKVLEPIHSFHCNHVAGTRVEWGAGLIGEAASTQVSYLADPSKSRDDDEPLVCIPMSLGENTVGVIAIFGLLEQKEKFVEVDFELFKLLAVHSASAIISAGLLAREQDITAGLSEYRSL